MQKEMGAGSRAGQRGARRDPLLGPRLGRAVGEQRLRDGLEGHSEGGPEPPLGPFSFFVLPPLGRELGEGRVAAERSALCDCTHASRFWSRSIAKASAGHATRRRAQGPEDVAALDSQPPVRSTDAPFPLPASLASPAAPRGSSCPGRYKARAPGLAIVAGLPPRMQSASNPQSQQQAPLAPGPSMGPLALALHGGLDGAED